MNVNDKKDCKFCPLGIGKNKATFYQIKDKIENDTQQTFGEGSKKIVESLRNMKECDWKAEKPNLEVSVSSDEQVKAREDRQCELLH